MERGKVRINNGKGEIVVLQPPDLVFFKLEAFDRIRPNDDVYFWRCQEDGGWACRIVLVNEYLALVQLAMPPAGLTRDARTLVQTTAMHILSASLAAPDAAQAEEQIALARPAMKAVAKLKPSRTTRVGVQGVRVVLADITPKETEP